MPGAAPLAHPHESVINRWQRGVTVYEAPVLTPWFVFFLAMFVGGTVIAAFRLLGGALGSFAAMTDAYAWGVWKTFNVMALTALGSGALAVGLASWVLGRHRLHTVMRTALVTSFLFYATGLLGLLTDVGRPWNFWNMLLPWRWNTESALWEVAFADAAASPFEEHLIRKLADLIYVDHADFIRAKLNARAAAGPREGG